MEKYGLGLARDGVVALQPHSELWEEAAALEMDRLSSSIGSDRFSFHHIGSTSISTLCAKPILDLLVLAPSLMEIDQHKETFEKLGYEYKGELGISGRRYCVLYNAEKTKGYVHIHAFKVDQFEADQHLLFRDYLRARPEIADQYNKLKRDLVFDGSIQRSNYTVAKDPFIKKTLFDAQIWRMSK